jgi:Flp pilus assembly protein TadG
MAREFLRSKRGNVAMMFAIALMPLMIGAGAGLDFTRAMMVRQQMGSSLDAAALAIGSTTGLDSTTAQALAQKYFDANYTVDTAQYGIVTINPPVYDANGKVTISATNNMPTVLMKLAGITTVPVSTSSTVVWGQTKLWVSLVLDNSGSMCQPDAQPCNNTANTATKIYQLKDATKAMLTKLQAVSATPGDVRVAIVPFNREVDVGTANAGAGWLYWGFWEAEPANANLNGVTDLNGPDDNCPFSSGTHGYSCQSSASNGSGGHDITSSGLICPSMDNGNFNTDHMNHYYNGCYNSVETGATQQVSSGKNSTCGSYNNCTCTGKSSSSSRHCDAKLYTHTWVVNAHSTWGGCVTDRIQDHDISITTPSSADTTGFPAANPANPVSSTNCMYADTSALGYNWTDLASLVDGMQAKGSTNQAIGVAHGWEMLVPNGPFGAPALPANTTRYIILFSDGLNTQNRWWGDGSTEGTVEDGYIDTRMSLACAAAKADGVVIYTLYVHTGGGGNSAPLQNCASDPSKYYDLTSSAQIATAFADITKKITNVRVSM